jgi:SAM-dependent methyltransferase
MCTRSCIDFARRVLTRELIEGRSVLEVGAQDVNGSVRPIVEELGPASYVGVDISEGPGVDLVLDATRLVERFGEQSFDVVLSTELLEHVRDWRTVIGNMKSVLRPGGTLLITTRSRGFWLHGWPWDFWRYEVEDLELIFADFDIHALEPDTLQPGVFLLGTKRETTPVALEPIALFSILTGRRQLDVSDRDVVVSKVRHRLKTAFDEAHAAAARAKRAVLQRTSSRTGSDGGSTDRSST